MKISLSALLLAACGAPPPRPPTPVAMPQVAIPSGPVDLEPDVAIVLTAGNDSCSWQLVDATSKQARRVLETPDACPERVAFDPYSAATYFEANGTIFRAAWGDPSATKVAPLPDHATNPRLFISADTGRLRLHVDYQLPSDDLGAAGARFEGKVYPTGEATNGIPSMVLVWELDGPGWKRVTTEYATVNPFVPAGNDEPDRKARAGTVSLRELLVARDEGSAVRELGAEATAALAEVFPPIPVFDTDEPGAAVFHLDATHHLIAALATGDSVQVTEPVVYCANPCTRWEALAVSSTPPGPLDQRAYADHLPLYIGVRKGVALVEEMVRGDRVAFYTGSSATPVMRLESSIGAWGPFRGFWQRTR